MNDVKQNIAKNITTFRQAAGLTQAQLAERLNYSDKAVSKWERGESLPDITVMIEIARVFEVPLDMLVSDLDESGTAIGVINGFSAADDTPPKLADKKKWKNRVFITAMSVLLVWFVAATVFVVLDIVLSPTVTAHRLAFVYAVPASIIVWLVMNCIWFNKRHNFLIIGLLMWSVIGALIVTMASFGVGVWQIAILGIPGTAMIFLWSRITGK